jgi:hypothetical protein
MYKSVLASYTIFGYLLLFLIAAPYLKKTNGMGSINSARKPSSEVAQPMPSVSYTRHSVSKTVRMVVWSTGSLLWTANNGKTAPKVYRETPLAAIADAPFSGPYTSNMYSTAEV